METGIFLIRIGVSAVMIAFGIHQLKDQNPWIKEYMPEKLQNLILLDPKTFMKFHGLGNILLGVWFLSGIFPIWGAYAALIWWVTILPFAWKHSWHTGIRDLAIILSILALTFLL